MEKYSKQEVKFEHPAKGMDHCGMCTHFQPDKKTCEIVSGTIQPADWCTEFKAKSKYDSLS